MLKTIMEISFLTCADQKVSIVSNCDGLALTCEETEGPKEQRKSFLTYLNTSDIESLIGALQVALQHQKAGENA